MKENRYDDQEFFDKYSQMNRSIQGLQGAGEWSELEKLLPDFKDRQDISEKMLAAAKAKNSHPAITYRQGAMEDLEFPGESFDVVLSSLAFHYVKDFPAMCEKIWQWLKPGGTFVFSVEHPVFTAYGSQDWFYDDQGNIRHFPVDNYYYEGKRDAIFLGEHVTKYHRTLTTYLNTLLGLGFTLTHVVEPMPPENMMDLPGMKDEMRRPMMLLVSCIKA